MKHTIELDSKDIARLSAKEYNVEERQVNVFVKKVHSGYRLGEQVTKEAYTTVTILK